MESFKLAPRSAFLAVAGRVDGPEVRLTNAHWTISAERIGLAFGFEQVVLVNDYVPFAVAAASMPKARRDDVIRLGPEMPMGQGAVLAVGAGTGFGAASQLFVRDTKLIQASEAGHAGLGAGTAYEIALWPHIECPDDRVTVETLLSGPGLVRLYRALTKSRKTEPTLQTPDEIVQFGMAGMDEVCVETLALFARLLGRVAGDLVLIMGGTGGVFIGSGIAPRIAPVLKEGLFRQAFERKAPFNAVMQRVPTFILTCPEPGLLGLSLIAANPGTYIFPYFEWKPP
jgi:glucokinase